MCLKRRLGQAERRENVEEPKQYRLILCNRLPEQEHKKQDENRKAHHAHGQEYLEEFVVCIIIEKPFETQFFVARVYMFSFVRRSQDILRIARADTK